MMITNTFKSVQTNMKIFNDDFLKKTYVAENLVKVVSAIINAAVNCGNVQGLEEAQRNVTIVKDAFNFASLGTLFNNAIRAKKEKNKQVTKPERASAVFLLGGKLMQCVDGLVGFGFINRIVYKGDEVSSRLGSNKVFDLALRNENWAAGRASLLSLGIGFGTFAKLKDEEASSTSKRLYLAHGVGKICIITINSVLKLRGYVPMSITTHPLYHVLTIGTASVGLARDVQSIREAMQEEERKKQAGQRALLGS